MSGHENGLDLFVGVLISPPSAFLMNSPLTSLTQRLKKETGKIKPELHRIP